MPMENQLAHAITQTEYDSSYDKAAKKLLANKQILAQIMKNCVNEYSACSVDEIAEKYIEGTPEVGTVGVHVDDTNRPKKTAEYTFRIFPYSEFVNIGPCCAEIILLQ